MFNDIKNTLIQHLKDKVPYVVEEKLDGSMTFVYLDPKDDKYKCATRGSFESEQSKIATELFQDSFYNITNEENKNRMYAVLKRYTPIFEVIYPENRFNDGARLVVDYGSTKTLILLAAINKETGRDLEEELLKEFGDILNFPLRKQYNYTIKQCLELQKTLPVTQEGFVVKFKTGFRVKIKGAEYCKMQKILNSISPLSIWEQKKFLHDQALALYGRAFNWAKEHHNDNIPKGLGLYTQKVEQSNLGSLVFARYEFNIDKLQKSLIKLVRPKGNEL